MLDALDIATTTANGLLYVVSRSLMPNIPMSHRSAIRRYCCQSILSGGVPFYNHWLDHWHFQLIGHGTELVESRFDYRFAVLQPADATAIRFQLIARAFQAVAQLGLQI